MTIGRETIRNSSVSRNIGCRVPRKDSRGFTLIEMLLVVLIIGILSATVVPKLVGRSEKARIAAAQSDIKSALALALDLHESDTGKFPDDLNGLIPKYLKEDKVPNDPWGNAYRYAKTAEGYTLTSDGPDKIQGTSDDI